MMHKKYFEKYQEFIDEQKEKEDSMNYEDKVLKDIED